MPGGKWIGLVIAAAALYAPWAAAQIDPRQRTYLEGGTEFPMRGNGPLLGYGFLLISRPHLGGPDNYLRIATAGAYTRIDWIHDNLPSKGQALGLGARGGIFSNNFYAYRDGRYLPGQSFRGHSAGIALSYFAHPYKIMGRIPVDFELRVAPTYLMYRRAPGTDPQFTPPEDSAVYCYRVGLRIGGVPPVLAPTRALELTLWYEADHRAHAGPYGLHGDALATKSWTTRSWLQLGGIIPLPHGQVVSLFYSMGATGQADPLDLFRLGGSLRLYNRFPLLLHGYYENEIFASNYRLVNAFYRFPLLPDQRRLMLQLDFDYANIAYFQGYALPHRELIGIGADLIYDWSKAVRIVTGYGYGPGAPRPGGYGASAVNLRVEIKL